MKTPLLRAALALATFVSPAFADVVDLNGDTTGQPVFNRPTETGIPSSVGAAVPFQVIRLTISLSGMYSFAAIAADAALFDTFIHLYVDGFSPVNPQANFVAANDDAHVSTTNSALSGIALDSAHTYFLVIDGFSNSDFGAYSATLSGPGAISATIPEPGVPAAAILAIFAIAARQRFRRSTRGDAAPQLLRSGDRHS